MNITNQALSVNNLLLTEKFNGWLDKRQENDEIKKVGFLWCKSLNCIDQRKRSMKKQVQEKIVGRRRRQSPSSPVEYHHRALALQARVDCLNPFRRPRGFVFKAKSWADYEAWKQKQTNPRLW